MTCRKVLMALCAICELKNISVYLVLHKSANCVIWGIITATKGIVLSANPDLLCFPLKNLVISGVSAYQILKPHVLSLVFSLTG